MSNRLDDLCEGWLSGELDEADAQELHALAAADPAVRVWLRRHATTDQHLRQLASGDDDAQRLRAAVLAQLTARGDSHAMGLAVIGRLRRRRWLPVAALAAAALLAVLTSWWLVSAPPAARLEAVQERFVLERGGALLPALNGTAVRDGDRLRSTGDATLRLSDGSTLTLQAGSDATFHDQSTDTRLDLADGAVACVVKPRPQRPLIIRTAHCEVTVIGTRFAVRTAHDATQVQVEAGRVQVNGSALREVGPGEMLQVTAQGVSALVAPPGRLPQPIDPQPPADAPWIRSQGPVPWTQPAGSQAPAIAGWTHAARPGEQLVLCGTRFGTAPTVWLWQPACGQRVLAAEVQLVDAGGLLVRMPAGLAAGPSLLWVANGDQVSSPVAINRPEPAWIGPGSGSFAPGSSVRVVGRSLAASEPWLRDAQGRWTALPSTARSEHELACTLPTTLPPGDYELFVAGGGSLPLQVAAAWRRGSRELTVAPSGGDDSAVLQQACDQLAAEPAGGTLRLPAGRFRLEQRLVLGQGLRLVGAGRTRTTLELAPHAPTDAGLIPSGDHIAIEDLALQGVPAAGAFHYGPLKAPYPLRPSALRLQRLTIAGPLGSALWLESDGGELADCDLAVQVKASGSGVWIHGNRLRGGPGADTWEAIVWSGERLILEDNEIASDWPLGASGPVDDRTPWCRTGFGINAHYGSSAHLLLSRNRWHHIGGADGLRQVIGLHGLDHWEAQVTEASDRRLRVDATVPDMVAQGNVDGRAYAVLLAGPGRGQVRPVISHAGDQIVLSSPWRVPPVPGDPIGIGFLIRDVIISGNTIFGPPGAAEGFVGIMVGPAAWDIELSANRTTTSYGRQISGSTRKPSAWIRLSDETARAGSTGLNLFASPDRDQAPANVLGVSVHGGKLGPVGRGYAPAAIGPCAIGE